MPVTAGSPAGGAHAPTAAGGARAPTAAGSARAPAAERPTWGVRGHDDRSQDLVFLALRGACSLACLAFALGALPPGPSRRALLGLLAGFVAYSGLLYALAGRLLRAGDGARRRFYRLAAVLDLALLVALIAVTGGARSPLYRALYLWVAMLAFLLGRRAGVVGAAVSLGVFLGFHAARRLELASWVLALDAGGLLLHGFVVGTLADQQRRGAEALRAALAELEEAGRRVVADQARLVHTEKLSSIGLLAAGLAHEVNNPLSGIAGCIKALREGTVPEARREEYFDTVRDGLERIGAAVRSLLDYARLRPPSRAAVDVGEIAAACLRLAAPAMKKKDLHVDLRVAPGAIAVEADRSQLMHALVNVLMNAAYASPPGAAIAVEADRAGSMLGIRVIDRGAGIPREVLGRVFDPFFTTKPEGEGTGLGLSVTLGLARNHGGDVTIETSEGQGTAVTIWLPAPVEAAPDA